MEMISEMEVRLSAIAKGTSLEMLRAGTAWHVVTIKCSICKRASVTPHLKDIQDCSC